MNYEGLIGYTILYKKFILKPNKTFERLFTMHKMIFNSLSNGTITLKPPFFEP